MVSGAMKQGIFSTILALAVFAGAANAVETVKVTFVSGYPPAATFVGAFVNGYVHAVDAALAKSGKYRISWNLAHSGQIAKPRGELEALEGGLGDIGAVLPPLHFDRLPLYEPPFVTPFTTDDPVFLSKVYSQLEGRFSQYHTGWAKANQKVIVTTPVLDSYIVISSKPIKTLADFKGVKVGAASSNMAWFSAIGAIPVQSPATEWFNGINTGIFQAANAWPQALGGFKLCQPAKYLLDAGLGANSSVSLSVNISTFWSRLPEEVRAALLQAGAVYSSTNIKLITEGAKQALETCRKQFGLVEARLSDGDRMKWAKSMPNIAQQWVERVERQGLPGKEILAFYMNAMRAGKQQVLRQWDRE